MTPLELKKLIQGDAQASQLLAASDDVGCAARCSVIAPRVHKITQYVEQTAYIVLTPEIAEPLLLKLEAYGNTAILPFDGSSNANKLAFYTKRVLRWLAPNSVLGWSAGTPNSVALVTSLLNFEVITQSEHNAIMNLSLVPQTITAIEVEFVRKRT